MDLLETIKARRSIRKFKDAPVEEDKLNAVLEAGRQAPSWANTQCWRFIVVRDADIIHKLADTGFGVGGAHPNRATEAMRMAPATIVVCAELGKAGCSYKEPREPVTDKGDWFMFDAALAMENMVLAATALGLGTVYIGAFDSVAAEKVLGVPQGYKVVSMTPLGYPDEEPKPRPRKELDEIVFKDKFGEK
ncbi:MAG: nitroreductase family protein [Dehalococcoidia bacterium]|jgi:nitroreductase